MSKFIFKIHTLYFIEIDFHSSSQQSRLGSNRSQVQILVVTHFFLFFCRSILKILKMQKKYIFRWIKYDFFFFFFFFSNLKNIKFVFFSYLLLLHFKSSSHSCLIRMKLNQDLIAWRDMAGRNWITTILSHHGWCTWSTIINDQGIPAEKIECLLFSIDNYNELELTCS